MQDRFGFEIIFNRLKTSKDIITDPPEAVYLLCQAISLPPTNLVTKQLRWDEGSFFNRPQGIDVGGEGLPIDFMLDSDMAVKSFFDAWMSLIFNRNDATVPFPELYMHQINLYSLDLRDNIRHVVVLKDAFPRSMSMVSFAQGNPNTPASLTVTFSYHHVETYSDLAFADDKAFDLGKFARNSTAYLQKAASFFASMNPTVYNIWENRQRLSSIIIK